MVDESLAVNGIGWFIGLLGVVSLWTIPWKGIALWKSARQGSKVWFIVFMFVNTLAILEILYIFVFSKKGGEKINVVNERPATDSANQEGITE